MNPTIYDEAVASIVPPESTADEAATSIIPPAPTADVHCAQHGCVVPREQANDAFCPVCNNPLHLIEDMEPPDTKEEFS